MVQSDQRSTGFNEENLPSNKYKKKLCKKNEIQALKNGTLYVSDYDDCKDAVNTFYSNFKTNHDNLKTNCNKENGPKCCRDVNYYLDRVTGIFKSSLLSDSDKNRLIKNLEDELESSIRANDIYTCERQKDLDSTRKRCILQHLYDLKEDEHFILSYAEAYKKYLDEKWEKIIRYTNEESTNLFIKIENDSMGIVENYKNFLYSSDYICGNNLDELSADAIKISTDMDNFITSISLDKISSNVEKNLCFNKRYVDMLKYKASTIQRINNALIIGIALLGVFLTFIFLHELSPLGGFLRRCTKNKIQVEENMIEVIPKLYENCENRKPYISYHSTPIK
ncbi:unspecified product [Plasmodium ovale curtisi]|uniref:Unspecified product n=1 Tax=Plasmodium ovale curtisi TaxID=864141 RepID=A0A1A8WQZ8_PLAOA|nr:unspecified product [Plasmodium ovale curtisi]